MTTELSTQPSTPLPMGSLREQSSSTLQAAIRSPFDAGDVLRRLNACFALPYFDPMHDAATKAAALEAFIRALSHLPTWAVLRAFDAWDRSGTRRPTPAEIVMLAEREIKPITDELGKRQRLAAPAEPDRKPVDRAAAAEIMARAGFTARRMEALRASPMSASMEEAERAVSGLQGSQHWSDGLTDDDPRMVALKNARAAADSSLPKGRNQ